jgi:hypothetical protein
MPAGFEKCQNTKGHRIRTISGPNKEHGLKKGEYMHVCFVHGEMHPGEKKTKKESK